MARSSGVSSSRRGKRKRFTVMLALRHAAEGIDRRRWPPPRSPRERRAISAHMSGNERQIGVLSIRLAKNTLEPAAQTMHFVMSFSMSHPGPAQGPADGDKCTMKHIVPALRRNLTRSAGREAPVSARSGRPMTAHRAIAHHLGCLLQRSQMRGHRWRVRSRPGARRGARTRCGHRGAAGGRPAIRQPEGPAEPQGAAGEGRLQLRARRRLPQAEPWLARQCHPLSRRRMSRASPR